MTVVRPDVATMRALYRYAVGHGHRVAGAHSAFRASVEVVDGSGRLSADNYGVVFVVDHVIPPAGCGLLVWGLVPLFSEASVGEEASEHFCEVRGDLDDLKPHLFCYA